jgi:hypothetical protein
MRSFAGRGENSLHEAAMIAMIAAQCGTCGHSRRERGPFAPGWREFSRSDVIRLSPGESFGAIREPLLQRAPIAPARYMPPPPPPVPPSPPLSCTFSGE